MSLSAAIRSFPSHDEAEDVARKLAQANIACRMAPQAGATYVTLFTEEDHAEQAAEIMGEVGFLIDEAPREPNPQAIIFRPPIR